MEEKVRLSDIASERGYLPRAAEVLLAENPAMIVGVVINAHEKYESHVLEDAFIASALNSLGAETARRGLQMMVRTVKDLEEIVSFATMWNLEGLVLIGFCGADYSHLRERVRIPFAVYDACGVTAERVCAVNIDDRHGGFQVGEYFRLCGHEKALCLSDNDVDMDLERWKGFREGFGPGAEFMMIPKNRGERTEFYLEKLPGIRSFTAIFAVSDFYAVDLVRFLQSSGVNIPGEISVAGFDDTPLCGLVYPSLTSVRQDTGERARAALDAIAKIRAGERVDPVITLSTSLVIRDSTRNCV